MKTRKTYQVILLVLLCILCNVAGRALTTRFRWPLWLDSFGTVCCSYVLGCVCGVMVGVTGNLIFSILFHARWIYLLTSGTEHQKELDAMGLVLLEPTAQKSRTELLFSPESIYSYVYKLA